MQILRELHDSVKPGMSAKKLDEKAQALCKKFDVEAAFHGVQGITAPFPGYSCISVNEQVLHTIPGNRVFEEGDLVKIDFGIVKDGYYTDHCVTVGVKSLSPENEHLLRVGKLAVESAALKAALNTRVGILGDTMQSIVELAGYNVLKDYVGHGIGKSLHLPPEIPAYGHPKSGALIREGEVLCVEAQVVAGEDEVMTLDDDWTIVTVDGSNSVMFEYMVLIENGEGVILTDTRDWPVIV
jgi:methionyl aminopeptidase